ncbi:transposon Tf2-1 polyprotein [Beta vulgaris subsp. vulgaris]|uniref:transposon Tf2-1 polyprotein n=1 Tax=Beta vulgaris subsp. vulgaris TaxID=3555 RepID=UPI0025466C7F|nr:transposon Tf2-1 polyprotein [Beta vulgaris subsp. vulgaris]XP_057250957.1 transposon Tf2-1 polyprotein [Beta vulgaris subsp. vulgaris]XP_057250958.1 transposon Tf2-1 polyprotein [Beta vulgaris subsp. vulgaris]XP_057250959.1 transposon Tf2-1 polyprotein [Beta vulgaris subsp. vulgaris]XP_057250960.1 transposon Tf2-1 polyprotein [Beta vulgaris subsp. vulgaris]XP_057250961.1 transposon Tf2-1 polyprotein [Beta vulgaris subsp. vulgaris]XP_057250962.1 transposon Tf2-1 polyprotein [Beta vulgaris 
MEGLPTSQGKNVVLVVVDRLTKYAHFMSIKHPYTAPIIAYLFAREIIRLHGTPTTIVSDRDKIFLNNIWKEIFKLQGSAYYYHPQSDGQTEVVNKSLESYLRCFINKEPKSWARWLHWAEYWNNTSLHSSTKCTPFKALYGRDPPHLTPYTRGGTPISTLEEQLVERDAVVDDLKAHLIRAQQLMKGYEDGKRREVSFEVGDLAYLKLQPYRQKSLAKRRNEMLAARYYGTFEVLEKIGPVAYKLKLPAKARIHPVFHVSQLKHSVGPQPTNPTIPPQISPELILEIEPEELLSTRAPLQHTGHPTEVLIKWKHLLAYEAAWEDFSAITARFPVPAFHLEDKVALLGRSNARYVPGEKLITYARRDKKGGYSPHLLEE